MLILKEINPRAIVILMTAFSELWESMQKGLAMNATACLTKPFELEDLIRTIREAVDRRKTELCRRGWYPTKAWRPEELPSTRVRIMSSARG